jgi:hypothetical protein
MSVRFSCVVDQDPKFWRQALVWALSLLTYADRDPEELVIHAVGDLVSEEAEVLKSWGVDVRAVERFDSRHANSNKLAQLESPALQDVPVVVLCDCDLAFCSTVASWIGGDTIRARIGSYSGLTPRQWEHVFKMAGLPRPQMTAKALLDQAKTLSSYCNGGLYIVPQDAFQRLRTAWPRWDRWLLERSQLLTPYEAFTDQISFAMSCEELGLSLNHLPLEMNCDGVFRTAGLRRVTGKDEIHPVVLHYHQLDAAGLLPLKRIPSINRQIRKINNLIRLAERVNFDKASWLLLRQRHTA